MKSKDEIKIWLLVWVLLKRMDVLVLDQIGDMVLLKHIVHFLATNPDQKVIQKIYIINI